MAKYIRCYKPDGSKENISNSLSIDSLRELLKGYVEIHTVGGLTIACDEEGKIKGLSHCGSIAGMTFVGDIYVGRLGRNVLMPVDEVKFKDFDAQFTSP